MTYYNPRISLRIYVAIAIELAMCAIWVILLGSLAWGIAIGLVLVAMTLTAICGVKYAIDGNRLGIRSFYRWTWIPINEIKAVQKAHGATVQSPYSATTSLRRVRIILADNKTLRSSMPVDVSPAREDAFIAQLLENNPTIVYENR